MFVVLLLASFVLIGCETRSGYEDELLLEDDGLTRTLTLELVAYREHEDKKLYERVRQFDQERSDVEVEIRVVSSGGGSGMSPWLLDKKGTGNPPDLNELTPQQMHVAYHLEHYSTCMKNGKGLCSR